MLNDVHCHFFSTPFFAALGGDAAISALAWDPPGTADALADRWVAELDRAGVSRAALIASIPGDAPSVGAAVKRHRTRFVGMFMLDPTKPDAAETAAATIDKHGLRGICLYPAMHQFSIQDDRVLGVFEVAAERPGTIVFVHCGVLSVGVRKLLGLPTSFDISLGNPLHLNAVANAYPKVKIIVPHFGAGMFREALMLADQCPNVLFDTSSSNKWIQYDPGLTLTAVYKAALSVVGPDRLLFGTDSSFFPRGWVRDVYEQQSAVLDELGADVEVREKVFGGNFERLFKPRASGQPT
jgi:uncharacterized protein